MMQAEEKALQQEEHTWKEGDKDICSQLGRQNSSQKPLWNRTSLGLKVTSHAHSDHEKMNKLGMKAGPHSAMWDSSRSVKSL